MSIRQVTTITTISQIIIMLIFLQGCASVIPVNIVQISLSNPQEKVKMDIALLHANELEDYSYSFKLWGGIEVAIPTAIPFVPFINIFGNFAGK